MDYLQNYNRLIHSIKTEEKMKFDMQELVLVPNEVMENSQAPVNFCGSAGCIIGHALAACVENPGDFRTTIWSSEATMDSRAGALLNLHGDALKALCYQNLQIKDHKRENVIEVLQTLRDIAAERTVQAQDVREAEHRFLGI